MGLQPSYGKGPHPLLLASSRAPRVKMTINGKHNRIKYCVIFRRVRKSSFAMSVCLSVGPHVTTRFHWMDFFYEI
jgi:hypothetical protein